MDTDAMEDVENLPAAKGPAKGAKAAKQPLAPNNAMPAGAGKSIEEMYQKKTQLEHIILRPDTYIGSTERQPNYIWVHNGQKMEMKLVNYPPGLYKIFDEILVNAADNKVRDATMDTLKVDIDSVTNTIRVWNNGKGIPVEVHKEEGVYVPELIFGHLLTSSNYNDSEKKVTGGRNGYGAKLANIFSSEFTVETCDGSRQRRYKQTFSNNMQSKAEPKITDCKATDNWTSITFKPDLAKFGMTQLDEDVVALLRRRVYDLAGVLGKGAKVLAAAGSVSGRLWRGKRVYYNGERIIMKSFSDYENGVPRFCERFSDRWEVCVSLTDGLFQQVSFVNSIATTKGGTHVEYLVNQIVKHAVEKLSKKTSKTSAIKPQMVRQHLWVFVNCNVENPAFDSQTKETLTLRASSFGSKCELPPLFIDKLLKAGLSDSIIKFAEFKSQKDLKKGDGTKRSRLIGLTKLDDANDAGGPRSRDCTLILTEGDSAKALAISGLGVVGRDQYGVFPLSSLKNDTQGKLLNVREASAAQIAANAEIQNIKQIMGLQHGKVYDSTASLRYGHLMIMTDQDHDGSHIKGLIMNFMHSFFPSLLKLPGFLLEFITPIVKAHRGRDSKVFYTMPEYEAWKESLDNNTRGWDIKYYKGLGTSTAEEAQDYFSRLRQHKKEFTWSGDEDGNAIELAFSKKRIDDRKEWLSSFMPGTYLDMSADKISFEDFINRELILFSRADLERSIPSMLDGLKPGQRKILYACFKRNLKKDIKVAQLSAYVAEHSAYHHGETSLASTVVNMAQQFVGSNNINLLHPSGQFGTRLQGGKDAASARYIYTRLGQLTRHMFNENDDVLLNYLNEEGQSIEPEWYVPILPTVLINGAEGIGTGWSTSIPNYNPRDIIANLRRLLSGEPQELLHPWYRGFNGTITESGAHKSGTRSYVVSGTLAQTGSNTLEITELPVRKWTQDYKEFLEGMLRPQDKDDAALIADYREHHSDSNVHFVVELLPGKMEELLAAPGGLEAKFKLTNKIATSNMMLFDKDGVIKQYQNPEAIIAEFFTLRLEYYEKRRLAMLRAAQMDQQRADNKVRFIMAVVDGKLEIRNRRRADLERDLASQGFDRMAKAGARSSSKVQDEQPADGEEDGGGGGEEDPSTSAASAGSYDYLLSMSLYSLTREKIEALRQEAAKAAVRVDYLASINGQVMWAEDLDSFEATYEAWEVQEDARLAEATRKQLAAKKGKTTGAKGRAAPAARKKAAKKAGSDSDGDDSGADSDFEVQKRKPAPAPRAAPAAKPKPPVAAAAAAAPAPKPVAAKPAAAPKQAPTAAAAAAAAAPAPARAPARKAAAAGAAARKKHAASDSDDDGDDDMDLSASEGSSDDDDLVDRAGDEGAGGKPKKAAAAKRAPAAAAKPAAATAAPPKAAAAPKPAARGRPKPLATSSQGSEQPSMDESRQPDPATAGLAARLAGRIQTTLVLSKAGVTLAAPAAVDLLDDDMNSPARGTKTAAGSKKPAAAKAPAGAGGGKGKAAAAAKQPAKRKGAAARRVEESDEEEDEVSSSSEEDETFELSAPSPAVAPKGKKGRVGPSPLGIKSMPRTAAGAAGTSAGTSARPAAAAAAAMATVPEERAAPAQRARRAATAKVTYVVGSDSDGDDGEGGDSDFEVVSDN
ncbi:DNA topoisomerase 2 [Tetrabaena socialis]|uniref:DNA topoisomerase 2 n=1 Tax=Tetrabaena socialis TaxID=47790 RepID=A0A2J8AI70_9CHLO|nr:DNA topoisomerase 2 [Tetrabaena socialis]|eukprot:PNH12210.1 DNA topoisomerase 2 [Tetrabaena socialis]